ncbi:MAG: hypothetical protein H7Y13_03870 [Sphingobacteriaceae bacterium]|nr:hypothetical protein [Sphingobacteriaceae bacterium]
MKIILLIMLTLIVNIIYAQETYTFDASKSSNDLVPVDRLPVTINGNKDFVILIKNYNPYLYDLDVATKHNFFFNKPEIDFNPLSASSAELKKLFEAAQKGKGGMDFIEELANIDTVNDKSLENKFNYLRVELDSLTERFLRREYIFRIEDVSETNLKALRWLNEDGTWVKPLRERDALVKKHDDFKSFMKSKKSDLAACCSTVVDSLLKRDYLTTIEEMTKHQVNVSRTDFNAPPITISPSNASEVVVTINLKPKAALSTAPVYGIEEIQKVIVFSTTGWRVSFSSGLFGSSLQRSSYTLSDVTGRHPETGLDTVAYRQFVEDHKNNLSIGVNLLMHFTHKYNKYAEIGFHIGAGVPINNGFTDTQYLAGVSWLYGYKQRIGVNVGVALGQVDVMSKTVNLDRRFKSDYTEGISTVKQFKPGFQISVTYNFSELFKSNSKENEKE